MDLETGKPTYMTGTLPDEPRPTGSFPYRSPDRRLRIGPLPREGRRHCRGGVGLAPRPRPSRKLTCRSRSLELEQGPGAPGCGPGCRGFESPRSPHRLYRLTCGFDRSPKFFLTGLLGFLLGQLCDVDHMESRGVWWRAAACSVRAVYIGHVRGGEGRVPPSGLGASAPVPITRSLLQVTYEC